MPSITSRNTRTFASLALVLASATMLAGCASIDRVVLPDADSGDSSSSGNPEVDELTQEYNTLEADYHNGYLNLETAMDLYHEACLEQLLEAFTTHCRPWVPISWQRFSPRRRQMSPSTGRSSRKCETA